MNHRLKINGNILEITLPDEILIDKVIVNRKMFSQRMRVCKSCKYHGLEGHEEPCVSCEVGNSNYVAVEERTKERTETHACDCISRQDAINAFEPDHPVDWYTTMIVDVLENLPSAESELPIKRKCTVCPHCSNCDVNDDGTVKTAEPEIKPISYTDCANAMLKMWIDNVLTDGEYNRIMDKLNAKYRGEQDE